MKGLNGRAPPDCQRAFKQTLCAVNVIIVMLFQYLDVSMILFLILCRLAVRKLRWDPSCGREIGLRGGCKTFRHVRGIFVRLVALFALCLWTLIMPSKSRSCGANRRKWSDPTTTAGGAIFPFDMRWVHFLACVRLMFQTCSSNNR